MDSYFDKSMLLRLCLDGRIGPFCLVAFAVTVVAFVAFASKDGLGRFFGRGFVRYFDFVDGFILFFV